MASRALVWFKRDLRLADHAPLAAAAACDEALALFITEPAWTASPEFEAQHLAFAHAALVPLRDALASRGLPLLWREGEAVPVLAALHAHTGFTHLFSHEETGPGWSYERDQAVARWCRSAGVVWQEWPQSGVVRRLRSRSGWAARWQARMDAPVQPAASGFRAAVPFERAGVPWPAPPAARPLPAAGEAAAQEVLLSFLARRGRRYRADLSSPLTAEQGCSRLSAHLAFGAISLRQVHQATEARIAALRESASAEERAMAYHLRGFAGRLRWHCHFMQKLEDEPAIEHRNFARSCDGLRDETGGSATHRERLAAWCEGRTGFAMVDACMRSLNATGWLNFRMRAMLVSFAAYHLWLHWRAPGQHLARQFLDFEPGIHWSQMQMQSGTTGINTLRIYSPTRQAEMHDPDGAFRRRWLPEWGTPAYPAPIVDERAALAFAKQRLYGLRSTESARSEASAIQHRHGSRKSGLPPSGKRAKPAAGSGRRAPGEMPGHDERQPDLFD